MIAGHAVSPVCPRCGRSVHNSIQLHGLHADLTDFIGTAEALAAVSADEAQVLRHAMLAFAASLALDLEAELTGQHRLCYSADPLATLDAFTVRAVRVLAGEDNAPH